MRFSDRVAKYVFVVSLAIVGLGGSFLYGAYSHWKNLPPFPTLKSAWDDFNNDSLPDLTNPNRHHLQPSRGQGDGVVTNKTNDDDVVLMVGFFDGENQARLVERDGSVLHRWSLDYFDHFPDIEQRTCDLANALRVDTHGAIVTEKGELVLNMSTAGR